MVKKYIFQDKIQTIVGVRYKNPTRVWSTRPFLKGSRASTYFSSKRRKPLVHNVLAIDHTNLFGPITLPNTS